MNALLYLRRAKLKNEIRSIFKKPARLIYLIIIVALLALTLVGGHSAARETGHVFRNIHELTAIAMALYLMIFEFTVSAGFNRGGNMFHMSDVNLLFPSPLSPQAILFHGLLQQMTASLWIGIFLLFQYTTLHGAYGISYGQLLFLLLAYALAAFLGQVTAMLLYSYTNGDERRKRIGQGVFYGVTGAFLLWLLACSLRGGTEQFLTRAVACANGTVIHCLPVAGWLGLSVDGILTGNATHLLLGFLICGGYFLLLLFLIFRTDADYYEDVLKSAEIFQSAITAKKEGTMVEASPQNVRLGRMGIGRGWGANVFFYKHRIENRRSRKFLLSTNSLIFAVCVIGFSLFMRKTGLLAIFIMATYLQMLSSMLGRFNLELTRPYIYLIPEPPFQKLLWALAEEFPSALIEGMVVFIPVGLILSLSPSVTLLCIVTRLSFAMVFLSANVVVERLWGGVTSRVIVFFLFFCVAIGMMAPGIVLAVVSAFKWKGALIVLTGCNVACSVLALFFCREMLQYAELNNQ